MPNDLISIIVTCYNREKYIKECLESVKNQTYTNFECIIVDDGSTDSSRSIIETYLDDPRFKYYPIDHVGFPEAKNVGLSKVTGAYTIFLDSDDIAYTYWLQLLYYIAVTTRAPITVCEYTPLYNLQPVTEPPFTKAASAIRLAEYSFLKMNFLYNPKCMNFMWNKLVRSDLYNGIHFTDQMALSDVAVMYQVFEKAPYVIQLKTPLIHYRQHDHNMGRDVRAKGDEYYVWRFNFEKGIIRHIYDNFPQARFTAQFILKDEIKTCREGLGEAKFAELVTTSDVEDILTKPVVRFIEQ